MKSVQLSRGVRFAIRLLQTFNSDLFGSERQSSKNNIVCNAFCSVQLWGQFPFSPSLAEKSNGDKTRDWTAKKVFSGNDLSAGSV